MKPWVIVIVVLILVLVLAAAAGAILVWSLSDSVSVSGNTVLNLTLGSPIPEAESENPFDLLFETDRVTLYDYWQLLDYAATDSRVKAISLEIEPMQLNLAQIEELREGLARFREAGKPVHAFLALDMVGESELYLATAADSITVNPDTGFLVNGLMAELTFFKRAMDKLEIKPQFIQFKEFKSAETYDRESMSPAIREMFRSILTDLEGRVVERIASDRSIEGEKVRARMADGMFNADDALETGLIDAVGYREDVRARLEEAAGSGFQLLAAAKYHRANQGSLGASSEHRVALITGEGLITSGRSDAFSEVLGGSSLAEDLREVRKNDNFDAVLLRVDSPGGSAVGSDMVWNEVRLLREAGKPVVVSMSGVAGSGGYYIAMGANRIVSYPSTITGSIGVIFGKFDLEGFMNWLGVTVDRVKLEPNADVLSPFTTLDEYQVAQVTHWMQTIYDRFVSKAAEGRGLSFEVLEARARGRIYTGRQAKEIELVDDLGGYNAAVRNLREVLELPEDAAIQLTRYPRPKTFWEVLSETSVQSSQVRSPLEQWVRQEWSHWSQAMPRLLMPEARIY